MSIFNEIFSNIANNTSKLNPQNYNEEILSLWLKLLLLIPGMLFRQAASINIIKSRIILFKNGDWGALLEELRTDLISPKQYKKSKKYEGNHSVTDSDFRYKNAPKIITEDGDLSKAFQAIVSPTTISPPTTESVEYLKSLHPQRTEDNEIPEDLLNHVSRLNNIPEATIDIIWYCMRKAKRGKAPDIFGWRMEHLIALATKGEAPWLKHFVTVINASLRGELPQQFMSDISTSRLIGIIKPDTPVSIWVN